MSRAPEGEHTATVVGASIVEGYEGKLVAEFDCTFGDHSVTCKHDLEGEYAKATEEAFGMVELAWPGGVNNMADAVGKQVPIRVSWKEKNGKTFVNAYFATSYTSKPAAETKLAAFVARNTPGASGKAPF